MRRASQGWRDRARDPLERSRRILKSFDPYWATDYRGSDGRPGEITQNKLAALLRGYEMHPKTVHPTKRADTTLGGYVILRENEWDSQWVDMMARYASGLPNIQTLAKPKQPDLKKRR